MVSYLVHVQISAIIEYSVEMLHGGFGCHRKGVACYIGGFVDRCESSYSDDSPIHSLHNIKLAQLFSQSFPENF